jgi:deazaflavin-dependent oxidoreductase (nitroreductase family)
VSRVTEDTGMAAFNRQLITTFRETSGVGELDWVNFDWIILLTTTGRRSGAPRTIPLRFVRDSTGQLLLLASNGGAPQDPDWFRNIAADPHVRVESTGATWAAEAEVLRGEERDKAYRLWIEQTPQVAGHQDQAGRELPVVRLRPS